MSIFKNYCGSFQIHMIYIYDITGHDKLLESLGISVDSMVSKGSALALSEVHLKYIAPLRVRFAKAQHTIENLDSWC